MKFINKILSLNLLAFMLMLTATGIQAQDKVDVVIMANGEIRQGKVTAVEESSVKFVFTGEDLEYDIKKSEISKIQFASGRTQTFDTPAVASSAPEAASPAAASTPTAGPPTTTAAERKNKIAVLPFDFRSNDVGVQGEALHHQIQMDCANSLRENTRGVVVQDPRTTNSILAQNNIELDQLASLSPKDAALMLGVEYVVFGTTTIDFDGTLSTGSSYSSYKDKGAEKNTDPNRKESRASGSEVSSGSSITTENYTSHVSMSIYRENGDNVYSDSREAFGNELDAYKGSLNYMNKRTPFGTKSK